MDMVGKGKNDTKIKDGRKDGKKDGKKKRKDMVGKGEKGGKIEH